jgi:hypothetical protein
MIDTAPDNGLMILAVNSPLLLHQRKSTLCGPNARFKRVKTRKDQPMNALGANALNSAAKALAVQALKERRQQQDWHLNRMERV